MFGLGTYEDCSPRFAGLMWGEEDLSASLGASENGSGGVFHSPYRLARDLCLIGAAAAEVNAIDTVYTDIDNLAGLEEETTRGATASRQRPSSIPSMSTSSTPRSSPPLPRGAGRRKSWQHLPKIPPSARSVSTAK